MNFQFVKFVSNSRILYNDSFHNDPNIFWLK